MTKSWDKELKVHFYFRNKRELTTHVNIDMKCNSFPYTIIIIMIEGKYDKGKAQKLRLFFLLHFRLLTREGYIHTYYPLCKAICMQIILYTYIRSYEIQNSLIVKKISNPSHRGYIPLKCYYSYWIILTKRAG